MDTSPWALRSDRQGAYWRCVSRVGQGGDITTDLDDLLFDLLVYGHLHDGYLWSPTSSRELTSATY